VIRSSPRKGQEGQFASSRTASDSADARKRGKRTRSPVDLLRRSSRGFRRVLCDAVEDCLKIVSGLRGPANEHLVAERLIETLSDRFVRQVFAPVELLDALAHLLPEPCVVVQVVFDKLLNVAVGVAAIFGGNLIQFGFKDRAEVDFHNLRLEAFENAVNSRITANNPRLKPVEFDGF